MKMVKKFLLIIMIMAFFLMNLQVSLIDNKDWIWTASGSAGVAFFDGTVWNYLNSDDGLLNNNVSNIAYDTNG